MVVRSRAVRTRFFGVAPVVAFKIMKFKTQNTYTKEEEEKSRHNDAGQ
jgi:hypothetical protein